MELMTAAFPDSAPAMDREMSIAINDRLRPKEAADRTTPERPIKITGLRPIRSDREDQKYIYRVDRVG